jgi:hypothetical protein
MYILFIIVIILIPIRYNITSHKQQAQFLLVALEVQVSEASIHQVSHHLLLILLMATPCPSCSAGLHVHVLNRRCVRGGVPAAAYLLGP